jgi:hypothetical protein
MPNGAAGIPFAAMPASGIRRCQGGRWLQLPRRPDDRIDGEAIPPIEAARYARGVPCGAVLQPGGLPALLTARGGACASAMAG